MKFKQGFLFAVGALFALAVVFTIIGSTMAQNVDPLTNSSANTGTITVTGSGTVYADPDMAQVSIGVTNDAATAAQAMSDNAQAMTNVINSIEQLGIASKDVKTSTVSLQPKYAYQYPTATGVYNNASSTDSSGVMIPAVKTTLITPNIPVPTSAPTVLTTQIVGYTATNTVTVTVRDLSQVGPVIDAGYNNGANQVNGVTFSLSDGTAASVYQQALQNAMTNGAAKAQALANAAGIGSIKIKSISESGMYYPMTFQALDAVPSASGAYVSTPISSGQNQVTATVSLTYVYTMQ